jgi:hypothetical protein
MYNILNNPFILLMDFFSVLPEISFALVITCYIFYDFNEEFKDKLKLKKKIIPLYLIASGITFLFISFVSNTSYCTGEVLIFDPVKKLVTKAPNLIKIYNPTNSSKYILQCLLPPHLPRVDHITNLILKNHEMYKIYQQNEMFLLSIQNKMDLTKSIFGSNFEGISAINRGVLIEFFVTNGGLRNCFPLHDSHIGDPWHSIKTTVCKEGPFFLGTMHKEHIPTILTADILLPSKLLGKSLLSLQPNGSYTYKIKNYDQKIFSPFKIIH